MNQEKSKALCSEVQKILADDLPYLPLWFNDVVSIHRRALGRLRSLFARRLQLPRHASPRSTLGWIFTRDVLFEARIAKALSF
jgi:hypothetical protein